MNRLLSRKRFVALLTLGGAGACVALNRSLLAQSPSASAAASVAPKSPALDPELVKQFVIKGHGDFAATREMLEKQPGLLNASWDWGAGDFETALEGAGHMGNREIANFLISRGARMNIFCAAMLGKLDVVKGTLTAFPDLRTSKGPHGLQLVHHAIKGGPEAAAVLDYLKSIGAP